jgi:pyruvate/2-oxoglutarate dehydrogenase complex dihydrolipoamide dehydrogenase (E3) component
MTRLRAARTKVSPADAYSTTASVGAAVFRGTATFTGPNSLTVVPSEDSASQTPILITFGKAVVAVGGLAAVPKGIKNLEKVPYHTNASLYNITSLPPRVGILGGGPIGLEMAQALSLLGSKVTVLLRSARPLPKEDPDAAKAVTKALAEDGVTFLTDAKTTECLVKQNDGDWTTHRPCHDANYPVITVIYEDKEGNASSLEVDLLLVATGRRANTSNLGLDKANVEIDDENGGLVVVNDHLQSPTNPNIYAVGDCASVLQFTHVAGTHAQMVVENALFGGDRRISKMVVPWCTFTEPEVAHVGVYAHEHPEGTFDTYTSSLSHNDRAICDGDDGIGGFVKVHCVKGTETVVGATVVAPHAGEMISELTVAVQFGIPLGQKGLGGVIHPYPTVSDAVGGCGFVCKMGRWGKVADGGDALAPTERGAPDKRVIIKATHQEMGTPGAAEEAAAKTTRGLVADLKDLANLFSEKLLTEAEFVAAKAKLLC